MWSGFKKNFSRIFHQKRENVASINRFVVGVYALSSFITVFLNWLAGIKNDEDLIIFLISVGFWFVLTELQCKKSEKIEILEFSLKNMTATCVKLRDIHDRKADQVDRCYDNLITLTKENFDLTTRIIFLETSVDVLKREKDQSNETLEKHKEALSPLSSIISDLFREYGSDRPDGQLQPLMLPMSDVKRIAEVLGIKYGN